MGICFLQYSYKVVPFNLLIFANSLGEIKKPQPTLLACFLFEICCRLNCTEILTTINIQNM